MGIELVPLPGPHTLPLTLPDLPGDATGVYFALDAPDLEPGEVRVVTPSGHPLPLAPGPRAGLHVGHWNAAQLASHGPPARVLAPGHAGPVTSIFLGFGGSEHMESESPDHLLVLRAWWRATPPGHPARHSLDELFRARLLCQQLPDGIPARGRLVEVGLDALDELPDLGPSDLPPALRPLFVDLEPAVRGYAWTRILGDADPARVAPRVQAFREGQGP
jgi:hypothetical protein